MPTTPDLIFEDAPPPKSGRFAKNTGPIAPWLDALRQYPGRLARYPEPANAAAAWCIKKGKAYGAKEGEFSVTTRSIPGVKDRVTLYATYLGEPQP